MKGTEAIQMLLSADELNMLNSLFELVDKFGEELKPRLEALSRFSTELDIKAIQQMVQGGLTQNQAVMLRTRFNIDLVKAFNK